MNTLAHKRNANQSHQRRHGFSKYWGRKLQFLDTQLQISDRKRIRELKSSILPQNSPKMWIFSPKFHIFERKFSHRLTFREGIAPQTPLEITKSQPALPDTGRKKTHSKPDRMVTKLQRYPVAGCPHQLDIVVEWSTQTGRG